MVLGSLRVEGNFRCATEDTFNCTDGALKHGNSRCANGWLDTRPLAATASDDARNVARVVSGVKLGDVALGGPATRWLDDPHLATEATN